MSFRSAFRTALWSLFGPTFGLIWSLFGLGWVGFQLFSAMATVFRSRNRRSFDAKIKVWNAAEKSWEWKKISTGIKDEQAALAAALALEAASGEARVGLMTRSKAERLVEQILSLAGMSLSLTVPPFGEFAGNFLEARIKNVGDSTGRKYRAHWEHFKAWAGSRIGWTADRWTAGLLSEYYANLLDEFSATTSNNHLTTLSMLFMKAQSAGHIRGNPVDLIERSANDSEVKHPFSRSEVALLLKSFRGMPEWQALTLLGWHTGHRIDDLLSLGKKSFEEMDGIGWVVHIQPGKKESRGGRRVVLPVPRFVAKKVIRLGDFRALHHASNRSGAVSNEFIRLMEGAGVDPLKVQKRKREISLKSFHSFRHSMVSRLAAAGVSGQLSRLVTDHESEKVHKGYVHAEVLSLAEALKAARRK